MKLFYQLLSLIFSLLFAITSYGQTIDTPVKELNKYANRGNAKAKAILAYKYKEGYGVQKDLKRAKIMANEAGLANDGLSFWLMAQIAKEQGEDISHYYQYLSKAFACDYPLAISFFARVFLTGVEGAPLDQDQMKAESLLRKAMEIGDADAAVYMFARHLDDESYDYEKLFPLIQSGAMQGNEEAMSVLGFMYLFGLGVPKDVNYSFRWFKKAVEAGSISGKLGLADIYRIGFSVPIDLDESFRLYSEIPEPTLRVRFILGYFYGFGNNSIQNVYKVESLWKPLAEEGDIYAQALLGITMYEGGTPFYKDYKGAFPFLKEALENKCFHELHPDLAQKVYRYLSGYYRYGRGIGVNIDYAEELTNKADSLRSIAKEENLPFAYFGIASKDELSSFLSNTMAISSPEELIDQITFDYPENKNKSN